MRVLIYGQLEPICYEMLIGYSPFDANNEKELYEKIEKGNYEIPTNIVYSKNYI